MKNSGNLTVWPRYLVRSFLLVAKALCEILEKGGSKYTVLWLPFRHSFTISVVYDCVRQNAVLLQTEFRFLGTTSASVCAPPPPRITAGANTNNIIAKHAPIIASTCVVMVQFLDRSLGQSRHFNAFKGKLQITSFVHQKKYKTNNTKPTTPMTQNTVSVFAYIAILTNLRILERTL